MAKNTDQNIVPIKPSNLRKMAMMCSMAKRAAFIWGPPGIGKSDLVKQLAIELSPHENGKVVPGKEVEVYDVRLLLLEPTDLRGIPYRDPESNKMCWSQPSVLPPEYIDNPNWDPKNPDDAPRQIKNNKICIVFLDELTAAPPSVQAAAYQLVLDRKVGDYTLPENCIIIAAGNRQSDKGVVYKMPTPLANRFIHFSMVVDFDDWAEWAISNRVHPQIMGYLSEYPSHLFDFEPTSDNLAFPTPRSWAFVSDLLYQAADAGLSDHEVRVLISGAVGVGVTHSFMAHRSFAKDLPPVKDILAGKAKKMGTNNISAQYFLSSALTYELHDAYVKAESEKRMDEFNEKANNFFEFIMENFRKELVVMSVRTALRQFHIQFAAKKMPAWSKFFDQYGELVTEAIRI